GGVGSANASSTGVRRPVPARLLAALLSAALVPGLAGAFLLVHRPDARAKVVTRSGDLLGLGRTFVAAMPGPESGGYQQPTAAQQAGLASAERLIAGGRLGDAAVATEPFGYSVVRFTDVTTGRHLVLLAQADDTRTHGWGMFVFA